jgi:hypothetical protein
MRMAVQRKVGGGPHAWWHRRTAMDRIAHTLQTTVSDGDGRLCSRIIDWPKEKAGAGTRYMYMGACIQNARGFPARRRHLRLLHACFPSPFSVFHHPAAPSLAE